MRLIRNAIQCLLCSEVIVSRHRHDYVSCKCGNMDVDGGNEYRRRGWRKENAYREACAWAVDLPSHENPDLAGKWIVFSPQGKSNSSVAFDLRSDAIDSALNMHKQFKDGDFYVAMIENIT